MLVMRKVALPQNDLHRLYSPLMIGGPIGVKYSLLRMNTRMCHNKKAVV